MCQIKVAITGGIGSGKSLVAKLLREWDYPVFSCDEIYKEVIQSEEYVFLIKASFPTAVKDNEIDRTALGQIVFNDEEKREKLNQIAHPMIMKKLFQYMNGAGNEIVFAEVPLLFEGNFEKLFDKVIYVFREKRLRVKGVMQRDGLSLNEIEKRIQTQFDPTSKEGKNRLKENSVICIENNGSIAELKNKILSILKQM